MEVNYSARDLRPAEIKRLPLSRDGNLRKKHDSLPGNLSVKVSCYTGYTIWNPLRSESSQHHEVKRLEYLLSFQSYFKFRNT